MKPKIKKGLLMLLSTILLFSGLGMAMYGMLEKNVLITVASFIIGIGGGLAVALYIESKFPTINYVYVVHSFEGKVFGVRRSEVAAHVLKKESDYNLGCMGSMLTSIITKTEIK